MSVVQLPSFNVSDQASAFRQVFSECTNKMLTHHQGERKNNNNSKNNKSPSQCLFAHAEIRSSSMIAKHLANPTSVHMRLTYWWSCNNRHIGSTPANETAKRHPRGKAVHVMNQLMLAIIKMCQEKRNAGFLAVATQVCIPLR